MRSRAISCVLEFLLFLLYFIGSVVGLGDKYICDIHISRCKAAVDKSDLFILSSHLLTNLKYSFSVYTVHTPVECIPTTLGYCHFSTSFGLFGKSIFLSFFHTLVLTRVGHGGTSTTLAVICLCIIRPYYFYAYSHES